MATMPAEQRPFCRNRSSRELERLARRRNQSSAATHQLPCVFTGADHCWRQSPTASAMSDWHWKDTDSTSMASRICVCRRPHRNARSSSVDRAKRTASHWLPSRAPKTPRRLDLKRFISLFVYYYYKSVFFKVALSQLLQEHCTKT